MHAYIDEHSQRLIDEYPGNVVHVISRLQYQFSNVTFADQRRYNRLLQKVIHKGGESEINYTKIFQNFRALEILLGNSYSED